MNIYNIHNQKSKEIPLCPCGQPTHLDKAYPEKGYTLYCSDACSKKYRSENKEYNKILSNKDWLIDQFTTQKKAKCQIAKELNCSETVINKWLKIHDIIKPKKHSCPEISSINYDDIDSNIELTKENLEFLVKTYTSKTKLLEKLKLKPTQFRRLLESFNIEYDGRKTSNTRRKHEIPPRDVLIDLYENLNLTILDISKKFNSSNVTVRKWFKHHDIEILEHAVNMRERVIHKTRNTMLIKYGNTEWFATDAAKSQIANTFIQKYGVPYHPINNISKAELEVLDFLNELEHGFKNTKIFGIELDGYNPNIKVAMEFNGLYWHSESIKGKNLHERKYRICKENDIRLFTIFEDEWKHRQSQVKSFIRAALNKNDIKLYARELKLEIVAAKHHTALRFLNDNHIQGIPGIPKIVCHIILLNDLDEIVSVMTFSKHHRNESEIVLSRYCVKSNHSIIGGAQRLFKHAIDYFKCDIKTWSDNRWTEGNMYDRLGFKLHQTLAKDYSYIVPGNACVRISKQSMTKTKMKASENQTEYERALELGFDRIWDCGKKTWIYYYG